MDWARIALAFAPHAWPLFGLLFLHWDVFAQALAYWGVLAGLLASFVLRLMLMPDKGKWGGLFFLIHGGAFLLGCLLIIVEYVGTGYARIECNAAGTRCSAYDIQIPWLLVLQYGGLSAVAVALQQWQQARATSDGQHGLGAAILIGSFYWRMALLFFVLMFGIRALGATTAAWLVLVIAASADLMAELVRQERAHKKAAEQRGQPAPPLP